MCHRNCWQSTHHWLRPTCAVGLRHAWPACAATCKPAQTRHGIDTTRSGLQASGMQDATKYTTRRKLSIDAASHHDRAPQQFRLGCSSLPAAARLATWCVAVQRTAIPEQKATSWHVWNNATGKTLRHDLRLNRNLAELIKTSISK